MKKKLGRPPLKAKERKEIVPMRLSAVELKVLKAAAKDQPLTTWMRETLLASVPEGALPALSRSVNESIKRDAVNAAVKKLAAKWADPKQGPTAPD